MNILSNAVPQWVSILFLTSMLVSIFMIANVAKQGTNNAAEGKKVLGIVMGFYLLYFVYVGVMSFTGIFQEVTLPPKIFIFTAIPLFIFLNLISKTASVKSIIDSIPLKSMVLLHTFRFIGVFFLITNAYGAIPTKFAYIAGIGDISTAILSIFVASAISNQKVYAQKLTFFWNIFGLLDILSVIVSAIVATKHSIDTGSSNDIIEIVTFPFSLIPAFAPATIVFLHICIFKKLKQKRAEIVNV